MAFYALEYHASATVRLYRAHLSGGITRALCMSVYRDRQRAECEEMGAVCGLRFGPGRVVLSRQLGDRGVGVLGPQRDTLFSGGHDRVRLCNGSQSMFSNIICLRSVVSPRERSVRFAHLDHGTARLGRGRNGGSPLLRIR